MGRTTGRLLQFLGACVVALRALEVGEVQANGEDRVVTGPELGFEFLQQRGEGGVGCGDVTVLALLGCLGGQGNVVIAMRRSSGAARTDRQCHRARDPRAFRNQYRSSLAISSSIAQQLFEHRGRLVPAETLDMLASPLAHGAGQGRVAQQLIERGQEPCLVGRIDDTAGLPV